MSSLIAAAAGPGGVAAKASMVVLAAGGNPLPAVSPITPPGAAGITQIIGWLMWGLVGLCLVGMMTAGGLMAVGHTTERPYVAARGKSGFMWALVGAAVIAAARLIVGAAFNLGAAG